MPQVQWKYSFTSECYNRFMYNQLTKSYRRIAYKLIWSLKWWWEAYIKPSTSKTLQWKTSSTWCLSNHERNIRKTLNWHSLMLTHSKKGRVQKVRIMWAQRQNKIENLRWCFNLSNISTLKVWSPCLIN